MHAGMRQHWRDFESLERWARSGPRRTWCQAFLKDSGGTGVRDETHLMRGDRSDLRRYAAADRDEEVRAAATGAGPTFEGRTRTRRPGAEPEGPAGPAEADTIATRRDATYAVYPCSER
jgi:hypothetical protein